jgi:quercetin dioxygenase-like cupin family protein
MSNITKYQKEFRKKLEALENILLQSNHPEIAKGNSDLFPLSHYFVKGLYIREMFIKKGSFVIGKIHKHDHVWFLLKGKLLVITDGDKKEVIAPFFSSSLGGTKKVVHAVEDCLFINVHPNPLNNKNIDEIEKEVVVENYKDYNKFLLIDK